MKKFTKVWQLMMVLLLSSSVLLTQAQKNVSAERAPIKKEFNEEQLKQLEQSGISVKNLKEGTTSSENLLEAEKLLKESKSPNETYPKIKKSSTYAGKILNPNESVTVTIGTGTNVSGAYDTDITPFGTYYQDGQNQLLFTASELAIAGIGAGDITEIGWEVVTADPAPMNGFNIEVKHTLATTVTGFEDGFTNVYTGTYTAIVGWNMFTFSSPFTYDGSSNLLIKVCFDNTAYTTNSLVYYSITVNPMNGWAYNDGTAGCTDPYEGGIIERPNTRITGEELLNPPPGMPYNESPINGSEDVAINGNITWTFGNNTDTYDLWFGPAGNMVKVIDNQPAGATGTYTYSGLSYATGYQWQVKAMNTNGTTNGPVWNFSTVCGSITAFPWTEGFEGVAIPALPSCWLKENGDWATTNNDATTYDADAHTGTQFLRDSWNAIDEYVWTPGFALDAGTPYDFSFWWAGDNYSGWTGDVFYNTTQSSTGATQLGASFVEAGTTTTKIYAQVINTLMPPATGTYYFGIRVNCPSSAPWYLSFDDFRFEPSPSCPMPGTLGVANIYPTSADLTWISFSGLSDIEFGLAGFPPTGIPTQAGITSPYNMGGLTAQTGYSFYVRDDCGGGDYSSWAGPKTFTTACDLFIAPFLEEFTTWPPLCWDLTGGTYSWVQYTTGVECARANFWGQTSGNTDIMTTPLIDVSGGNFGLEFYWSHLYSTSYPLDALEVLVSDDNGANWTQVWYKEGTDFNSNDGAGNTTPGTFVTSEIIPLSSFGSPIMVRFFGHSGYGPDVFIDNVNVFEVAYGDLAGTVTKLSNGTPVEGANISLGSLSTTTGSDGTYSIPGILVGNYMVTCNGLGYNIETASVTILEDQLTTQDFSLTAPLMVVNPLSIEVEVEPNGQTDEFVNISNPGNGPLDWSAQIQVLNDKETLTDLVKGSQAYAFQIYPDPTAVVSFDTDEPGSFNTIAPTALDPFAGDFGTEDNTTLYIITYTNPTLYAIDITTGAETMIAPATGVTSGQNVSGMACDKTTGVMYASSTDISASDIYTVNLETGELTLIGTTGIPGIIEIAIDGTGTMYAWDIVNDEAFTVDKSTGASTLLGPLGYNLNYAQGGNWDPVSDVIYLAAYSASGQLMTMDKATGALTVIGDFPSGAEVDALAFPGGFSTWLSIDPHNGTIEAGNNTQMTVHFDATDMLPGVYQAEIHFSSNPNVGSPVINVTMTVAGLIPAINLSANFTCTDVELTWEMPTGGNPDSWNVYRDGVLLGNSTVMEYTDAMVMPNVLLSYYVKAVYAGEESMPSSTETITVPIPGSLQPIGLSASANTPTYGYVTLDWNEPNACLEPQGYHVYRDNVQITTTPVTDLTFIDGPLGAGLYEYKLKAVYYFGQSGFSTAAYALIPVGIEETDDDLFRIFPNPASQMVTIESAMEITGIKVFNNSGQVVLDEIVNVMNYQIDVSKFDKGIYYIRLETGDTKILRKITIN